MLVSLTVPVTKNMMPSFRLIAYYHPSHNEVVSDSVWVDVEDSCMGSVRHRTTTTTTTTTMTTNTTPTTNCLLIL